MKRIPVEFLDMVRKDISRIDDLTVQDTDEKKILQLHRELDGRYQACISDWGQSMWGYVNKQGFAYSMLEVQSLLDNLKMMKSKLETFSYQVNAIPNMMPPKTNITVNIDNKLNLQITFETVRSKIESMTSLTADQTREAVDKVNDIESIIKSNDNKKTKWEKVKPIFVWLADKSVDVGMELLPLLLKI